MLIYKKKYINAVKNSYIKFYFLKLTVFSITM